MSLGVIFFCLGGSLAILLVSIIWKFFGKWGVINLGVIVLFSIIGFMLVVYNARAMEYEQQPMCPPMADVYVFAYDVPAGAEVIPSMLRTVPYPQEGVMALFYLELSELDGDLLCRDVYEGELLTDTLIKNCENEN